MIRRMSTVCWKFVVGHQPAIFIVAAIILGGGHALLQSYDVSPQSGYATIPVQRSTLTETLSGNGQVSAAQQTDITTEVSGDVMWIGVEAGDTVWRGQIIARLDTQDILDDISDAEWELEEARRTYNETRDNAEDTLTDAYNDGYSSVSESFFKLSDYMEDLSDVVGGTGEEYITDYKLLLGADSAVIQNVLYDYHSAQEVFDEKFELFQSTYRGADEDTIYALIHDTAYAAEYIAQALESARHMYDAIALTEYDRLNISSHISSMQSTIENDVSSVYSTIQSLTTIQDTIDDTQADLPNNLASAERTVEKAEQALAELKADLTAHAITAPYTGIIADVSVETGNSVNTGNTIATIITEDKIAEVTFNEIDIARIALGQEVVLTFDAFDDLTLTGLVSDIDILGTVSQGIVSYTVGIAFHGDSSQVKPGMNVSADIITAKQDNVLVVPLTAVTTHGDRSTVQVVKDSVPQLVPVETGISNNTQIAIVSGLSEGDLVIVEGVSATPSTNTDRMEGSGFISGMGALGGGVGGGRPPENFTR